MKGKIFLAAFGLVLLIGVGTGAFFMGKSVAQDVTTWKEAGFLYATLIKPVDDHTLLVQGSSVNREEERGQFLLSIDEDTEIRIHGLEWEVKDMFPGMRFAISYEGEIPEGDLPTLSHVLAIDLQGNYHEDGSWSYEEELP